MPTLSTRRRAAAAGAAALLTLVLAWALWPSRRPARGQRAATPARLGPVGRIAPGPVIEAAPTAPASEATPGAYHIGDVSFDRTRLCKNDDVLIHVEASDPTGATSWLLPIVRFPGFDAEGFTAVGRVGASYHAEPQHLDELQVDLLDTRTRAIVASKTVPFVVDDCEESSAGLRVDCGAAEIADDEVVCEVHTWDEDHGQPVRYQWQVLGADGDDDAAVVETQQAWSRLTLPRKPQSSALTSYLIAVRGFDADGRTRAGRTSWAAHNTAWETSMLTGVLELKVRFDGAPVQRDGKYVTHVTVYNPFTESVSLDSLQLTRYPCGQPGAPIVDAPTAPVAVLGKAVLGPGESAAYDWVMPVDEARCAAQINLSGAGTSTGLAATGLWIMPSDPSRRVAVTGVNRDRLRAALDVLSRRRGHPVEQVTGEELADLAREGVIAPLQGAPAPIGPLAPGQSAP